MGELQPLTVKDAVVRTRSVERAILLGFAFALIILFVIGVLSYRTTKKLIDTAGWVNHTHKVMQALADVQGRLREVQNAAHGYLLTGGNEYRSAAEASAAEVTRSIGWLESSVVDMDQRQRLRALEPLVERSLSNMREIVGPGQEIGPEAAKRRLSAAAGQQVATDTQSRLQEMRIAEEALLGTRESAAKASARQLIRTLVVGTSLAVLLVLGSGIFIRNGMKERIIQSQRAERELQRSNDVLLKSVTELEQRTREIARLGDMGDLLQSCQSVEEAYRVLAQSVPQIVSADGGALGITSPSRNLVEIVATWGTVGCCAQVFAPDDCWALRRGRMNVVEDPASALHCKHIESGVATAYLCVPLVAQGDALGILNLSFGGSPAELRPRLTPARQRLIGTVADRIALAIANLKLRAALLHQSVRDPLTGLFNRRYMEESLERELRRATRSKRPLGVLMLDLDHFKRFNDNFGHDAGDAMLREFSSMLRSNVRGGDIACRYGGEEFALILPEASLEITCQRAEFLREKVRHLDVQHRGLSLGGITISIGVAGFPGNGSSWEALLQAADTALYAAKTAGRDRVSVAPVPPEAVPDA